MKFLLDVLVERAIAEWLREEGYEVVEVREIDPHLPDSAILQVALQENRIIITMDKDFGELAVRQGHSHCGIIRLPDVPILARKALLQSILQNHSDALSKGALITVGRQKIRIRYR
ncbi:MAG: DUF5615 family PIN-like protein [Fimbriimonadales bacterium]|nr:DUF5615 family PIN-like protein [Fimbriimonadales bacterium]